MKLKGLTDYCLDPYEFFLCEDANYEATTAQVLRDGMHGDKAASHEIVLRLQEHSTETFSFK